MNHNNAVTWLYEQRQKQEQSLTVQAAFAAGILWGLGVAGIVLFLLEVIR